LPGEFQTMKVIFVLALVVTGYAASVQSKDGPAEKLRLPDRCCKPNTVTWGHCCSSGTDGCPCESKSCLMEESSAILTCKGDGSMSLEISSPANLVAIEISIENNGQVCHVMNSDHVPVVPGPLDTPEPPVPTMPGQLDVVIPDFEAMYGDIAQSRPLWSSKDRARAKVTDTLELDKSVLDKCGFTAMIDQCSNSAGESFTISNAGRIKVAQRFYVDNVIEIHKVVTFPISCSSFLSQPPPDTCQGDVKPLAKKICAETTYSLRGQFSPTDFKLNVDAVDHPNGISWRINNLKYGKFDDVINSYSYTQVFNELDSRLVTPPSPPPYRIQSEPFGYSYGSPPASPEQPVPISATIHFCLATQFPGDMQNCNTSNNRDCYCTREVFCS
jgi:hypothetical protein